MGYKKILIDANVCLDVTIMRHPFYKASAKLFEAIESKLYVGVLSADSLTNIFYVTKKLTNKEVAFKQLKLLYKLLEIGTVDSSTIEMALSSGWGDFEDAIQFFCGLEHSCDAIITRNEKDFGKSTLPTYTPEKFVLNYLT